MLVSPDKERSPGVWQGTHKLLACVFANEAKSHAKSELFSGYFPFLSTSPSIDGSAHRLTGQTKSLMITGFPGGLVGYGNPWLQH